MRSYIFTTHERRMLERWLETDKEDQETRNLFVKVRLNMNGITRDVRLLTKVAKKLRAQNRIYGRTRLPPELRFSSQPAGSASTPKGRERSTSTDLRRSSKA